MTQPTLINLQGIEYSQEFHIELDRCAVSSNTLNDLSNEICVPKKTEDWNLIMFNMITGINELKALRKHIACGYKCKFDERKYNSDQWWNNHKCLCACKKRHVCEKYYIWNLATCSYKNGKYWASIMDDSAIMCDEIRESYDEEIETIPTNFNKKKATCKIQNFYTILNTSHELPSDLRIRS